MNLPYTYAAVRPVTADLAGMLAKEDYLKQCRNASRVIQEG